jgi:inorganic pyrophosphatase
MPVVSWVWSAEMQGSRHSVIPPYEVEPSGFGESPHPGVLDVDPDSRRDLDRLAVDEDVQVRVDIPSGAKAANMGGVMSERLLCVIEIPKGSRNKYELDHETGAIKLDRLLFSSVHYPTDYGFFPDTWALDNDPLDAMVCVSEPTFPGCQIEVKPIALLRMRDEKGIDDKVLCVPRTDPGWNSLEVLEDIPQGLRDEIAHFFSIYKNLERKQVEVDGWYSREDALAEIEASRTRFEERQKKHG